MASTEKSPAKRLRGSALLREVYAELYLSLGQIYTPLQLITAAQALIDTTSSEYSSQTYQDGLHHPGYYSRDVFTMIAHEPWCLLEYESQCHESDGDDLTHIAATERLKRYHNPDKYYHRG